jgi:hypothetical protein
MQTVALQACEKIISLHYVQEIRACRLYCGSTQRVAGVPNSTWNNTAGSFLWAIDRFTPDLNLMDTFTNNRNFLWFFTSTGKKRPFDYFFGRKRATTAASERFARLPEYTPVPPSDLPDDKKQTVRFPIIE